MTTPPGIRRIDPDAEAARLIAGRERARTADLMQGILRNLGALSAIVPPGPLRERVDDEAAHMTALWEAHRSSCSPATDQAAPATTRPSTMTTRAAP